MINETEDPKWIASSGPHNMKGIIIWICNDNSDENIEYEEADDKVNLEFNKDGTFTLDIT